MASSPKIIIFRLVDNDLLRGQIKNSFINLWYDIAKRKNFGFRK